MRARLSSANSQLISRQQLQTIPAPPSTPTWRPIPHADLVDALDRQLRVRGITITAEQFAVQREGARLFAVLDLSLERTEEFCASIGIRTANDRSLALELAVGVRCSSATTSPSPAISSRSSANTRPALTSTPISRAPSIGATVLAFVRGRDQASRSA